MKHFFFVVSLLVLACPFRMQAQERYTAPIADSVAVDTYTYADKNQQELQLDLYQPALDTQTNRPVLLYVHGGGFSGGARNEANIREFCSRVASCGYVAVSVSYRLTRKDSATGFGCDCPASEKLKTFRAAVDDVQDATYFLIERSEQLGIDPHRIILAGSSAGAETVLNTAFQPPYCYGLDSGPVSYAGVISMAGAIPDTAAIYNDSAVPALFFHGTSDQLVPYASAPHRYCSPGNPGYLMLHGSYTMAERLRQLGKPYWLHTICGGDHAIASTPMTDFFDEIIRFCSDFVLKGEKSQVHTIDAGEHLGNYPSFNFCDTEK